MNFKLAGLIAALIVIVISAVVIYTLFSSLDSIVKNAIEYHGTQIMDSRVTLEAVEFSLTEGRGTLRGVRVDNPDGFSSEPAFTLGEITLDIDVNSLASSPLVIEKVHVLSPSVRFETDESGRSNLDVLTEKIRSFSDTSEPAEDGGEETRLRIKEFIFEKGTIEASIPQLEQEVTIELPSLQVKEIGGSDGRTPAAVGQIVAERFLRTCILAVSKKGLEKLIDEKLGGEAGEAAKGILDAIMK